MIRKDEEQVQILQIIPAVGWKAHFEEEGQYTKVRSLVCFALISERHFGKRSQSVRPMVWHDGEGAPEFCDAPVWFDGDEHDLTEN